MNLKKRISNNHIIAISIGIIYLWFGGLKYISGLSSAEHLAKQTIDALTLNLIPSNISIILLAVMESLIGLFFIFNIYRRQIVIVALIHMAFTFTPFFLFPKQVFNNTPLQINLLGQYIIKNLVIVAALITLYKQPITT